MTLEQIVASLTVYFTANYAPNTTVQRPNEWVDKENLSDWVEVYVARYPKKAQRWTDNLGRMVVEVRCYAKWGGDKYRIHTLATGARETMSQANVKVYDYSQGGEPQVGILQFDEGERQEETRDFNEPVNTRIRAVTWRFTALVQEL